MVGLGDGYVDDVGVASWSGDEAEALLECVELMVCDGMSGSVGDEFGMEGGSGVGNTSSGECVEME